MVVSLRLSACLPELVCVQRTGRQAKAMRLRLRFRVQDGSTSLTTVFGVSRQAAKGAKGKGFLFLFAVFACAVKLKDNVVF